MRIVPFGVTTTVACLLLGSAIPTQAATLFGTSFEGKNLFKYDTITNTTSTVLNTSSGADSMVFDSAGRIVYSLEFIGEVRRFDPSTNTDVLLAQGLSDPADLALEPNGTSVLVGTNDGIRRISSPGVVSTLTTGVLTTGIVYTNTGRLFANTGGIINPAGRIVELDPSTGLVLNQSDALAGLDGLTFDKASGKLFAASFSTNGIYAVDPTNLTNEIFIPNTVAGFTNPDGIVSGGDGNLYFATRTGYGLMQYNIAGNSFLNLTTVFGIDDLAPASGLGAPPAPVPEPASTFSLLAGGLGLLLWKRKKARQKPKLS